MVCRLERPDYSMSLRNKSAQLKQVLTQRGTVKHINRARNVRMCFHVGIVKCFAVPARSAFNAENQLFEKSDAASRPESAGWTARYSLITLLGRWLLTLLWRALPKYVHNHPLAVVLRKVHVINAPHCNHLDARRLIKHV